MYEKLRIRRKQNETTVKTLAKLLKLETEAAYFKKETKATAFTLDEAFILAEYFNTTVDELFGNDIQKKPDAPSAATERIKPTKNISIPK